MARGTSANARLRRILHLLPSGAREGGAALEEVARGLGVDRETVLEDIREVTARSFYLPAGAGEKLQIHLTRDRIQVWTTGEFTRPVRLLPREVLALGLGLRALATAGGTAATPEEIEALRRRLEEALATAAPPPLHRHLEPTGDLPPSDDVPGTVFRAARERRACRIRYLKPGAPAPEKRTLHPWIVARAEGRWYALGQDPKARDDRPRIFRLDRIVEARLGEERFEIPQEFEPSAFVDRGRLFRGEEGEEVKVRYSPRIARWIREKPWARLDTDAEELEDGSLLVRHAVVDPEWLVRHVLTYGPDAEVVAPEWARERVEEAARRLLGERRAPKEASG